MVGLSSQHLEGRVTLPASPQGLRLQPPAQPGSPRSVGILQSKRPIPRHLPTYYFAGVFLRIAERDGAVEVNFIIIPDKLEDGDVEATRQ